MTDTTTSYQWLPAHNAIVATETTPHSTKTHALILSDAQASMFDCMLSDCRVTHGDEQALLDAMWHVTLESLP